MGLSKIIFPILFLLVLIDESLTMSPIPPVCYKLSAKKLANLDSSTDRSDGYAKVYLNGFLEGGTKAIHNTFEPNWTELFQMNYPSNNETYLGIEIRDDDQNGKSDLIGWAFLYAEEITAYGSSKSVPISNQGTFKGTLIVQNVDCYSRY